MNIVRIMKTFVVPEDLRLILRNILFLVDLNQKSVLYEFISVRSYYHLEELHWKICQVVRKVLHRTKKL